MHRKLHSKNFVFLAKEIDLEHIWMNFLRFLPGSSIPQPGTVVGGGSDCTNPSIFGWVKARGLVARQPLDLDPQL